MLLLVSYCPKGDNKLAEEQYLNYMVAIQNYSSFNYFTVVKVKNLNTGEVKEICTYGSAVIGSLSYELNSKPHSNVVQNVFEIAGGRHNRYFELKNKQALDNISFNSYNTQALVAIKKEYNFDKIGDTIKKDKKYSIRLPMNKKLAFAHALFNKGYLSGENNRPDGILYYVDRTKEGY